MIADRYKIGDVVRVSFDKKSFPYIGRVSETYPHFKVIFKEIGWGLEASSTHRWGVEELSVSVNKDSVTKLSDGDAMLWKLENA